MSASNLNETLFSSQGSALSDHNRATVLGYGEVKEFCVLQVVHGQAICTWA